MKAGNQVGNASTLGNSRFNGKTSKMTTCFKFEHDFVRIILTSGRGIDEHIKQMFGFTPN